MTNNTHKVASMLIAAARALEDDFLHFGISGERVFCSAPSKRMVFVYRSDGIKVATMGNVDEIYKALFLLRHTPVFILERSVSTFAL